MAETGTRGGWTEKWSITEWGVLSEADKEPPLRKKMG